MWVPAVGYERDPQKWKGLGHPARIPNPNQHLTINWIHPGRLTWNIIIGVWKIIFLSKWVICMFHVNLPGCKDLVIWKSWLVLRRVPWLCSMRLNSKKRADQWDSGNRQCRKNYIKGWCPSEYDLYNATQPSCTCLLFRVLFQWPILLTFTFVRGSKKISVSGVFVNWELHHNM